MKKLILSTLLLLQSLPVVAEKNAFIIGGGADLQSSQGQIELNVDYAKQSLKNQNYQTHLWFSDGKNNNPDVMKIDAFSSSIDPITRILGNITSEQTQYFNHRFEDVIGSTDPNTLLPELIARIGQLTSDDEGLILYNGHGSQDVRGVNQHKLDLWNNTTLNVEQLQHLLQDNPAKSFRYIMTQCYSGAFHLLSTPEIRKTYPQSNTNICGFSAVSPYQLSEGCSASIDLNDYRDYTTAFFAAINGKNRTGLPVQSKADFDLNTRVTPLEAHWYALGYADNSDIPWSSSEFYLQNWQPWYLRWLPQSSNIQPENIYTRLADINIKQAGIDLKTTMLISKLRAKKQAIQNQIDALNIEFIQSFELEKKYRTQIINQLHHRWPKILEAYTTGQRELLKNHFSEINTFIKSISSYPKLVEIQNNQPKLTQQQINLHRQYTRINRIFHLRHMARLHDRFMHFANSQDKADYLALRQCEEQPF